VKTFLNVSIKSAICVGALMFGLIGPAKANEPKLSDLMTLIKKQQQQINALSKQLKATEGKVEQAASAVEEVTGKPSFLDTVKVGGAAEVEMTNTESFADADTSDLTLAKVEFYIDTQPHDYLTTHVQMLYEDDGDENITLDEAYGVLGNTEKYPLYLQAGKWAMPFGGFDTAMSSDPLTKSLGETKEASVLIGAQHDGLALEGYIFNGDTQKGGGGNHINQFGAQLGYGGESNSVGYNVAIGYLNNIADTDGMTTGLGDNTTSLSKYIPGFDVHGDLTFSGVTLRGGYIKALKSFQTAELAFNGQGAQPAAWNVEAAYTMPILNHETTFAGTVQGTEEAFVLGLPELRYGGAISVAIVDNFSITAEYLHDLDYDIAEGGTGNSGHTATLKLIAEY
jgi:hypothetical protein